MKKTFRIGALCAAMFALVLTSCSKEIYVVTFNSNGGSNVESVAAVEGKKITAPANPTKNGFAFAGWYKEDALTTAWDFKKDVVNSNITLYAKWEFNVPATSAELVGVLYYGQWASNAHDFELTFLSENGSYQYVLDIYSVNAAPSGTGISPDEGTYTLDLDNTYEALTISAEYSYVGNFSTMEAISLDFANVVITKVGSDYKVEASLIDVNGNTHAFVYQGPLAYEEPDPFGKEPQTVTTVNLAAGTGSSTLVQTGVYTIVISGGETYEAHLLLFTDGDINGTYQINDSQSAGSVAASQGRDYEGYHYSFIWMGNGDVYYLASGTVTISDTGVNVAATSHYGSTINISSGPLTASGAPAKIAPKASEGKVAKFGKTSKSALRK
ncbi:MAG: InlB B-repeat-containing protein [Prevotellaceae bacterium]|nr:InlB B-repeat-containing protein [Prevotellaceae bacterium]